VSGWGYERSKAGVVPDTLRAANVPILTYDDCKTRFQEKYNYTVYDKMLCAGGEDKDACQVNSFFFFY